MSTDLRNVPTTDIMQTRFFGGQDRGTCIQLTPPWRDKGHIQLTREEAAILAAELLLFAEGNEVTEQLHQLLQESDGEAICEALCS
tara:strand:- start:710 stop:967 length:258 start_codon:yes stop_codon:yes gene_type:complete